MHGHKVKCCDFDRSYRRNITHSSGMWHKMRKISEKGASAPGTHCAHWKLKIGNCAEDQIWYFSQTKTDSALLIAHPLGNSQKNAWSMPNKYYHNQNLYILARLRKRCFYDGNCRKRFVTTSHRITIQRRKKAIAIERNDCWASMEKGYWYN